MIQKMKMQNNKLYRYRSSLSVILTFMALLLFLSACGISSKSIAQASGNKAGEREKKFLTTEFMICHIDNESSELIYKLNTKGFIYKKTTESLTFTARFVIKCKLFYNGKTNSQVDTGSVYLKDVDESQIEKIMLGKIQLKTAKIGNYELDIQLIDLNGSGNKTWKLNFERKAKHDVNYFYLMSVKDSMPLFNSVLKPNTQYCFVNNSPQKEGIRIEHYENGRKLPPPIFVEDADDEMYFSMDSLFYYGPDQKNTITFKNEGIYKFYLGDSATKTYKRGILFNKHFPKIGDYATMAAAMRYILNKDEFKTLVESSDKQNAVEKQWLAFTENKERAERTIKSYYGRVETANKAYTSTIEGWKTDRGLVRIIFGAPDKINYLYNREVWAYYIGGNFNQILFDFYKEDKSGDYILNRSINYKDLWYYAIETWRQGRSFLRD